MSSLTPRRFIEFLVGDLDDPAMVAIQIVFKACLFGMPVLIAVEVLPHVTDPFGFTVLTILAALFAFFGIFFKLGDG